MAVVISQKRKIVNRLMIATVILVMIIFLIPIYWITSTSFKSLQDSTAVPPKVAFTPELTGMVKVFTKRSMLRRDPSPETLAKSTWYEKLVFNSGEKILRASAYPSRLWNSIIISVISTFLSISMGTLTAYGFSRFKMGGADDWLFFILSTRMLPPVVVTIPLFLMYRTLGLYDTHFGMILLYTAFNLSFSVWLMKGFIDEIPVEYEEAAMIDGYSRFEAFWKIVLPQSVTGMAATAVFCFIAAWNEYAFALILSSRNAQTAPPFIPSQMGSGLPDWTAIAAGTVIFLIPVVIFTFALRKHLLRGVTFGAIRK
ncbi:MAG: carbohydrate ABC transporter permease [Deltaproteobacteria bacterium]|jgi:multiple sugar transport system permease protein|nr:carbohydrate ABC transporter permease [Deltaproteobacteria bacterium]MBT4644703.1 carbohydrate ABC transporter permease [Deltaproteobacteria bacterium]MBT6503328.1 carbohydrate ABC transporter permease [Deltaproteobacteria bacterium]MBT7153916.1 carbohydrate ABC transporter permease [Deltaproteobacteria bacterium]MBT7711492.1 carbohydrate ABC transporter permease [Deltaproteobacteria bacterium]